MTSSADTPDAEIVLRAPRSRDKDAWLRLYLEYAVAVDSAHTGTREAEVFWEWLMHGTHRIAAFFAFSGDRLAGFAHYRPFPRTLDGNEACFLDDLFVAPEHRGAGIAERLIGEVVAEAARHGWAHVRWVTTPQNVRARKLYDRLATESGLLTYEAAGTGGLA